MYIYVYMYMCLLIECLLVLVLVRADVQRKSYEILQHKGSKTNQAKEG